MYKACSRCGKVHDIRYKCTHNKSYPQYEGREREQRSSIKWQKKREDIREQAQNLCEVCRDNNIYNYRNLEVHHITKLKENPDGLLEDSNLICLCIKHHRQADNGKLSKEYLQKLAMRRITRT